MPNGGLGFPPQVVSTVAEALARMQQMEAALPPGDGVGCFNRMYIETTKALQQQIANGFFRNAKFMAHLDVVFANLFFAAADDWATAPDDVARAWAALLENRARPRVAPIQFALAGMNAHINHDLPLALLQACLEEGCDPDDNLGDYQKVNAVLASIEEQVRDSFLQDPLPDGFSVEGVEHAISSWSIEAARDAAWVSSEVCWQLRHLPPLLRRYEKSLDRMVGLASRGLLGALI
jgi:hypothetical protein